MSDNIVPEENSPNNERIVIREISASASNGSAGDSGCKGTLLGCGAVFGVLVMVAVGCMAVLVMSGVLTLNSLFAFLGGIFNQPTQAQVVATRTIVTSLQPLGQLVSISVEVAKADIGVSVNTGGINLCGHSANHVAQGVIEAGVDITQVKEDNIEFDEASNKYTITLPYPTITSCRIEYIRQYERSGGGAVCSIDWDNVRVLAQYVATTQFAQDMLDGGIIDRAQRETTMLIQSFVGALTDGEVEVLYSDPEATISLPPSCEPQLPRGWTYDAENDTWVQGS